MQVYRHTDGTHVRSIGRNASAPWPTKVGHGVDMAWTRAMGLYLHSERSGMAPGEFTLPTGIAAAHGRLYVSDGGLCNWRLQELSLEGQPLQAFDLNYYGHNHPAPRRYHDSHICADGRRVWVTECEYTSGSRVHMLALVE